MLSEINVKKRSFEFIDGTEQKFTITLQTTLDRNFRVKWRESGLYNVSLIWYWV